jgi:hypothetical protein
MSRNALRSKALAFAFVFSVGSAIVQADVTFIDFESPSVKLVHKQVNVQVNGQTVLVDEAYITETPDPSSTGTRVTKVMTSYEYSDGAGGKVRVVTQQTTTATLDVFTGNYTIEKITKTLTTPLSANSVVNGSTTTSTVLAPTVTDVTFANLLANGILPALTFSAPTVDLDPPVTISPE